MIQDLQSSSAEKTSDKSSNVEVVVKHLMKDIDGDKKETILLRYAITVRSLEEKKKWRRLF